MIRFVPTRVPRGFLYCVCFSFAILVNTQVTVGQQSHRSELPRFVNATKPCCESVERFAKEFGYQFKKYEKVSHEDKQHGISGRPNHIYVPKSQQWFAMQTHWQRGSTIRTWNLETGEEEKRFRYVTGGHGHAAIGAIENESTLVAADTGSRYAPRDEHSHLYFWDRRTGELIDKRSVKELIAGVAPSVATGLESHIINGFAISPDHKAIALRLHLSRHKGVPEDTAILWIDSETKDSVHLSLYEGSEFAGLRAGERCNNSIAFANNNEVYFLGGNYANGCRVFSATTSSSIKPVVLLPNKQFADDKWTSYSSVAVNYEKGIYAVAGFSDSARDEFGGRVSFRSLKDSSEIRTTRFPARESSGDYPDRSFFCDAGKRLLLSNGLARGMFVIDVESGTIVENLGLQKGVPILGTDQILHCQSKSNSCSIYSRAQKENVVSFFPLSLPRHWITASVAGGTVFPKELENFWKRHPDLEKYLRKHASIPRSRPGRVSMALSGIPAKVIIRAPTDYQAPKVQIVVEKIGKDYVEIQVSAQSYGERVFPALCQLVRGEKVLPQELSTIKFPEPPPEPPSPQPQPQIVDGVVLPPTSDSSEPSAEIYSPGDSVETKEAVALNKYASQVKTIRIPFVSGRNEMSLSVTTTDSLGTTSASNYIRVSRTDKVKELSGRLLMLSVGVGKHKFDEYNTIQYPGKDVTALSQAFKKQEGHVFGSVVQQTYVDEKATLKNIRDGLDWIKRASTSSDVAVIFIAGHGYKGRRGLYFLPHDGDLESIQDTCLNWEEITKQISGTKAKQVVFLSDVCHAGGFGETTTRLQSAVAASLKKLDRVLVFASSGSDEYSLESDVWQHGAFTLSMLEALKGRADVNGDKKISLNEFTVFTIRATTRLTKEKQHPYLPDTGKYDENLIISKSH